MPNWEYEVLTFSDSALGSTPEELRARLNELDAQGWEVVAVTSLPGPGERSPTPAGEEPSTVVTTWSILVTLRRPRG